MSQGKTAVMEMSIEGTQPGELQGCGLVGAAIQAGHRGFHFLSISYEQCVNC